jgi:hypothetical protein
MVGARGFEPPAGSAAGEPFDEAATESLLKGLKRAPLGLERDQDFRIAIAGAHDYASPSIANNARECNLIPITARYSCTTPKPAI